MKTLIACAVATLSAVTIPAWAQQRPEIRQLGPVIAASTEPFGSTVFVHQLPSGVLVNDPAGRRLMKLDANLSNPVIVADSTPATASAYSGRTAGLIAYRGDSSLFIDAQSMSMLVIDPDGKVGRVMSVPRSQDAMVLGNTAIGRATYDGAGKIVYRGFGMPRAQMRGGPGGGGAVPSAPEFPDSNAIVRVDLATRQVDTIAWIKIPRVKMDIQRDEATGRVSVSGVTNPLPVVDEWAVLSDGSIAVVRGRDYHVDFIRPDGTRESAPKMPFDWQRLTDEDKVAFIDSLKAARERFLATQPAPPAPVTSSSTTAGPGGSQQRTQMVVMGGGGGPAGGGPMGGMAMGRNMSFVPPDELPDYKPPFFAGNVRADGEGNLWILTIPTKGIAGGPVYDVVNGKGELVERVQVPAGRTIVDFGAGGFVYLSVREGTKTTIEKAKIR